MSANNPLMSVNAARSARCFRMFINAACFACYVLKAIPCTTIPFFEGVAINGHSPSARF